MSPHQKLPPNNLPRRLAVSGYLSNSKLFIIETIRSKSWYKNLLVSDECWLTLGGHVYDR